MFSGWYALIAHSINSADIERTKGMEPDMSKVFFCFEQAHSHLCSTHWAESHTAGPLKGHRGIR